MSRKVPFLRFVLGIDRNRPFLPSMILMSETTKASSMTMDANAFSLSSSTGKTRTSVISMSHSGQALAVERCGSAGQRLESRGHVARGHGPGGEELDVPRQHAA